VDIPTVPLDGEEFLPGPCIPYLDRFVHRSAGQALAVRAEGHPGDPVGMPLQGKELLAGLGIPYFHFTSFERRTSTRQASAVRAEGHAGGRHTADESLEGEGEEFLAGLRIPHLHLARASRDRTHRLSLHPPQAD